MNANCQVGGDANAYVAGELPLREQTDFEAHLTVCDECRDAVAATRRVIRRLHALPKLETTRDLSAPVLAQLREAQVHVEDLEIGRADLEDVFLEIMQGVAMERKPA